MSADFSDDCGKQLTADDRKTLQNIARAYARRALGGIACEKCRAELLYEFLGAVAVEASARGEPTVQLFFRRGAEESAVHQQRLGESRAVVDELLRGGS